MASTTKLWRSLDPRALDREARMWSAATRDVADTGARLSSRSAANYTRRYAAAETRAARLGPPITPVSQFNRDLFTHKLNYAIARVKIGVGNSEPLDYAMRQGLSVAISTVVDEVSGAARDTILSVASGENPTMSPAQRPEKWARTASAGACAFCAMLAGRGDVYTSEDTGSFEAHNLCDCTAELVYSDTWSPSPQDAAHREAYDTAMQKWIDGDIEAKDRLNAFRQYLGNN